MFNSQRTKILKIQIKKQDYTYNIPYNNQERKQNKNNIIIIINKQQIQYSVQIE